MKCQYLLGLMMLVSTSCAQSQEVNWKKLGATCDPPGRPSVKAAKIATQGMTRLQMTRKLAQFRLALSVDKAANSTARSVLRREVQLIEIALEN